jgi:hypothetical protein
MKMTKTELARKGFHGLHKLATSRHAAIAATAVLVLLLSSAAAHADQDQFFQSFNDQGSQTLVHFKCALRGTFGWFMIAFGVILALWEYFVQRQGHLLVVAIIGVIGIIILGRVLPGDTSTC